MKKIDFEYHFYLPGILDEMKNKKYFPWYDSAKDELHWNEHITQPQNGLKPGLYQQFEERIRHMESAGIDAAVLSSAPGVEELEPEISLELCRKTNDAIYTHMKRYPGKFYGSATLPVQDPEAACNEMKRCVQEMGFVAWHAHSNFIGKGADDPFFRPIFETVAELGAYVYLHPRCPDYERLRGFDFVFSGPGLGFTGDAQITIMRMILNGTFDELPNLKVMLGHLGEALPFLLQRMENRFRDLRTANIRTEHGISHYFMNNILVSTSGNLSLPAFECTREVMGIDRMFVGTDNPFERPNEMTEFLDRIEMPIEEREKLYYKNAENLFSGINR